MVGVMLAHRESAFKMLVADKKFKNGSSLMNSMLVFLMLVTTDIRETVLTSFMKRARRRKSGNLNSFYGYGRTKWVS